MSEFQLHCGDALSVLKTLPSESVDTCVTSPPYFGLRDYQTATWEGGDANCDHGVQRWDGAKQTQGAQSGHASKHDILSRKECHCGAARVDRQLGLEATPDEYVARLVEVFREVRRVLKPQACLWLNLGDTYASNWPCNRRNIVGSGSLENGKRENRPPRMGIGLKDKDLIGIPWMCAFALRSDGWWLRQDIIWHKPNPMPESVLDRCTKSHEYLFLVTKNDRYYYDSEAIKESSITNDPRRPYTSEGAWEIDGRSAEHRHGGEPRSFKGSKFNTGKTAEHQMGRASGKPRTSGNKSHKYVTEYQSSVTDEHRTKAGLLKVADIPWEWRNKRSVWTISSDPYPDAHFAVMPEALVEPCILAGCPESGTVLDPFCGSGTVGAVALLHKRNFIGIDLNPDYIQMARRRLYQASSPLLGDVEVSVAG